MTTHRPGSLSICVCTGFQKRHCWPRCLVWTSRKCLYDRIMEDLVVTATSCLQPRTRARARGSSADQERHSCLVIYVIDIEGRQRPGKASPK